MILKQIPNFEGSTPLKLSYIQVIMVKKIKMVICFG